MKQRIVVLGLAVLLGFCLSTGIAAASDTSPYLVGVWMESETVTLTLHTYHFIVNPTMKDLSVFAVYHGDAGSGDYRGCIRFDLASNSVCKVWPDIIQGSADSGTAKFFAFPADTRKFDPNAVIGGFQRIVDETNPGPKRWTESNLKAVTINSSTIGEFNMIGLCKEYFWCQGEENN